LPRQERANELGSLFSHALNFQFHARFALSANKTYWSVAPLILTYRLSINVETWTDLVQKRLKKCLVSESEIAFVSWVAQVKALKPKLCLQLDRVECWLRAISLCLLQ